MEEPTNAERAAEVIYRDRIREAISLDPTVVNRPLVHRIGSVFVTNLEGEMVRLKVKKGEAGIYLVEVTHQNGAIEYGVANERELVQKLD